MDVIISLRDVKDLERTLSVLLSEVLYDDTCHPTSGVRAGTVAIHTHSRRAKPKDGPFGS